MMNFLKITQLTMVLLASAFAGSVLAHNIPDDVSNATVAGTAGVNYDVYHTTCFSWDAGHLPPVGEVIGAPTGLRAAVRSATVGDQMRVTVGKAGLGAKMTSTDATGGDGSIANEFDADINGKLTVSPAGYSASVKLIGNTGQYDLVVSHSGTGSGSYNVLMHCQTNTHLHAGTATTTFGTIDYSQVINY